jgi:hypothetical protein
MQADVWDRYDLTAVWGEPFEGNSVSVTPSDTGKATIVWPSGVSPGGSNIQNARLLFARQCSWRHQLIN